MTITVGYPQTNRKTDTGKTLKRWPVLVDHFSLGKIVLLLRGGQMRIAGSIVSVVGYDELKRVKDNSMDSKTTKLWRHMQLRHSIDSGSIWYDPVGNYAAMLNTLDPLEWARLFGRK